MPREYGSLLFLPCRCIKQDHAEQKRSRHLRPQLAMQTFTLPAILTGEASKPRKSLEAIALRSELWRRYPMKTVFCWSDVTDVFVTSDVFPCISNVFPVYRCISGGT